MADADKTTATEGLSPIPFDKPCTIAEENANGGWAGINTPTGAPGGARPKSRPMRGAGNRGGS